MLIWISRRDPPDSYAHLIANSRVSLIEWEVLRFTLAEVSALAEFRKNISGDAIRRLHVQSEGWAAGLTLLMEGSPGVDGTASRQPAGREALFAYFAQQSFAQAPRSTQEFLVTTALLSQVPASLAFDLTHNAAAEILEDLYRRHLFTHRRGEHEHVYWYHALYRDFLLSRVPDVLGGDAARHTQRRAAFLLSERGLIEEAFHLYAAAGDWGAAANLAGTSAATMLARGRGQTLREWIFMLPESLLAGQACLRHWLGVSMIQTEPGEARKHLEIAAEQFARQGDVRGQALAVAAIIDSYFYEWSDFRPVRTWVGKLESLIEKVPLDDQSDIARRLYTSLLLGMLYAAPGNHMLPRVVQRVSAILDEDIDHNSKMSMAVILFSYCNLACDMDLGRSVIRVAVLWQSTRS